MDVKFSKNGTTLVAHLSGELDQHSARGIKEKLEMKVRNESFSCLSIDLTALIFMDSSGIGVFIAIHHMVDALGGEMELICREGIIHKMVHLAGLSKLMNIRVGGEHE